MTATPPDAPPKTSPGTGPGTGPETGPESDDEALIRLACALEKLTSEGANPASARLDTLSPLEIATLMNQQDQLVAKAVEKTLPAIARTIESAAASLNRGGRLIHVGAGTSGRLGVLDASEIPPTFSMPPDRVIGLIAGGMGAMFKAREGAEDDPAQGARDIAARQIDGRDTVVGIAASGRTPYVLGALAEARARGAVTVGLACNPASPLAQAADIAIIPEVGPEVLSGSTRLKAGTAQKLVLNMISTGAMVAIGKCHGNRMVDLRASNEKLKARALNLVCDIASVGHTQALAALKAGDWDVKVAVLIAGTGASVQEARRQIAEQGGQLRQALAAARNAGPAP